MKLSEIQRTLQQIRVVPVKSLGQNFLHDQNLAQWIVREAEISAGDFVVEIGPGLGALTAPALATGAHVLAIEKDARLVEFLRERFAGARLEIVHGDAARYDVRQLFRHGTVKLLGNLPYYISTAILVRFLEEPTPITQSLLMLQREVAARLSATHHSKEYGILSVILQSRYRIEYLRTIPASVFLPPPEIESALVRLTPRAPGELPEHDREILKLLVRHGFSQRRKQLGKLLKDHLAEWPRAAKEINARIDARAEELSLGQWIALANFVRPPPAPEANGHPAEMFAVVDENDRVIGTARRAEVHGNNLLHRAVHVFIFNRAGELLLQKRSRWKDKHPCRWDSSAAGHVEAGERYDQTATREVSEELGITCRLTRVTKLPASTGTDHEFIWLYRGEHDGPFALAAAEIECAQFFTSEMIDAWLNDRPADFASGFAQCWRAWRDSTRQQQLPREKCE